MFQNAARPRGRPRSFDETVALEKATQVFWSKGYDGVTIDDLVAGMGVGGRACMPSSATSGEIGASLRRRRTEGRSSREGTPSPQSLRDSIAGFLRYAVESATEKGSARGALWCASRRLWTTLRSGGSCKKRPRVARRGGRSFPGRDHRRRNPARLSGSRARDPSHGFCSWPDHACADRHAAQDASQGCRGSGRLGAPPRASDGLSMRADQSTRRLPDNFARPIVRMALVTSEG